MALRTRIAVTFLLLLTAVLAAALGAVSATNHGNAEREVQRQLTVGVSVFSRLLESNRRQLTQAAQAVAADYGFREAVSTRDTDTLVSVLENSGERIGAGMVVLTSLNGDVIATSGLQVKAGTPFPVSPVQRNRMADEGATSLMVDNGRIFEFVTVPVRSPLPVALISMGFELDDNAARELAEITGLAVTLSVNSGGHWTDVVSTVPPGAAGQADVVTRRIEMSKWGNAEVVAILSRSLADARAPFERLTNVLFLIAAISLIASALAAFWLARNITRPLQDLTQAVDQMRDGTYDVALSVQRRDELGVLAEGLQLMQTAVQSRDQSIRRLAYEDSLTGLMNRTAFGAALEPGIGGGARRADRGRRDQFGPLSAHQRASRIFGGRRRAHQDGGASRGRAVREFGGGAICGGPVRGLYAICATPQVCKPGEPRWSWRFPSPYSSRRNPSTSRATVGLALAAAGAHVGR